MSPAPHHITNALTIDVEDWFQVSALAGHVARADWDRMPRRVERNVDLLLDLLQRHGAHATFFTLAWVAERHPALIRRIVAAGHELASHGMEHERASDQDEPTFAADVARSKAVLEDIGGTAVAGYRAPSFSISRANPWAFDALARAGYRYSSSVYPVRTDHYGIPDAPRVPYRTHAGLIEIPMTTARVFGRNLPASGGGYFRLAPYALSRWAYARFHRELGAPAMFYMHPWEVDPDQPRLPGVGLKTRVRHYLNLHRMQDRLARLLTDFAWDRVDRAFARHLNGELAVAVDRAPAAPLRAVTP